MPRAPASSPQARPAAEAGTVAPFTFRRWNVPASTGRGAVRGADAIMWWDNRQAVADIVDIRLERFAELRSVPVSRRRRRRDGGDRLSGVSSTARLAVVPARHSLVITRGLNGPSWQVATRPACRSRRAARPPHASVSKTLGRSARRRAADHQKCAFAVSLSAHVKTTNGAAR